MPRLTNECSGGPPVALETIEFGASFNSLSPGSQHLKAERALLALSSYISSCLLHHATKSQAEMIERNPLDEVHNNVPPQRKVQRTYGRKNKTQASLQNAKAIFTMPSDLELRLENLTLSDEKGNETELTKVTIASVAEIKVSSPSKHATKTASSEKIDAKSTRTRSSKALPEPTEDNVTIKRFVKKYADRDVLSFRSYGNTVSKKYEVKKIGEGTYSSVFALTLREGVEVDNECKEDQLHKSTIIKMMPILLPSQGECEGMTEPFHIANELQTMKVVDRVHGFIRYRGTLVVKGVWPPSFLTAFRNFRTQHPKKAENEDPEVAYSRHQYYALIEMDNAGIEINDIKRPSDFQIYDIFWQTVIHLANAEQVCGFEHRDLHVSNICVKCNDSEAARIDVDKPLVADLQERPARFLGISNIAVTIIDYTFSRVTLPPDSGEFKHTNFREFLMEGQEYDEMVKDLKANPQAPKSGDEFEDLAQTLTYAKVAKMVELADEAATREGRAYDEEKRHHFAPWEHHEPRTNVAWLGYLITCLLGRAGKMAKTKYVAGSNALAKTVQDDMRRQFLEIRQALMDETDLTSARLPNSAADVVRLGVEKGWLTMHDIDTFKQKLEEES